MAGQINVLGLPSSQKTPGIYLAVVLGGPGTSAGDAPQRILLLGNMINSNISGTNVVAGTATVNVPVQVFSAADALTKFGAGSELHLAANKLFEQVGNAEVWACPTPQGTGTSTGIITFTNAPTGALTLRVQVGNRSVDVAVASGDSLTTIASNVVAAVNADPLMPATAGNSSGVVTLTYKHTGIRGTFVNFRVIVINGTASVKLTAGNLATTQAGLTTTLSGGTAVGNQYKLTGGSAAETITTALTNCATMRFHRYAAAQSDSTNLAAIATQVDTMAGTTTQLLQQWVAASVDTYANAIALSAALNKSRGQILWHYNADAQTCEIAAQGAAARLFGDSVASGRHVGEAADPACNLDGLILTSIKPQDAVADQPLASQIEPALNYGIAPLAPAPGNPSAVMLVRSITTRWKDDAGNPNYGVLDTSNVTITDNVADTMRTDFATTFSGTKLGSDSSDGSGPKVPNVVTPKIIRDRAFAILKDKEQAGIVINVDAKASLLQVVANTQIAGRVDMEVPVVPIPGVHIVGGNVRQLSP